MHCIAIPEAVASDLAVEVLSSPLQLIAAVLERIPDPLVIFDADTNPVHQNSAFVSLDAHVRARVRAEARLFPWPRAFEQGGGSPTSALHDRSIHVAGVHLQMTATPLAPGVIGDRSALLVSVERQAEVLDPDALLREQYRLTAKELRVARLLALGESNARVAEQLCISLHTARHHAESVLQKLGVHSRAAVAARLSARALRPARSEPYARG
jgi:DNA-binding CsgD family transcriptional regulator